MSGPLDSGVDPGTAMWGRRGVGLPEISIVICTRNRAEQLRRCIASVLEASARLTPNEVEIIVVDNGSTDQTQEILRQLKLDAPVELTCILEKVPGLARARNTGIAATRGNILVFVDDDCRLVRSYLQELLRHWRGCNGAMLLGGRVELGDPADFAFTIKTDENPQEFNKFVHPAGFLLGCNLTFNRAALEAIGPFDERLGAGSSLKAGEDTDYIVRAHAEGIPVCYVPDMCVYHFHGRRTQDEIRRVNAGYALGNGALYFKHLFSSPWLLRNLKWDGRKALGQVTGVHAGNGAIGVSLIASLGWNLVGAVRFALLLAVARLGKAPRKRVPLIACCMANILIWQNDLFLAGFQF